MYVYNIMLWNKYNEDSENKYHKTNQEKKTSSDHVCFSYWNVCTPNIIFVSIFYLDKDEKDTDGKDKEKDVEEEEEEEKEIKEDKVWLFYIYIYPFKECDVIIPLRNAYQHLNCPLYLRAYSPNENWSNTHFSNLHN